MPVPLAIVFFFPNLAVSFVDVYSFVFIFASQNETDHPLTKLKIYWKNAVHCSVILIRN